MILTIRIGTVAIPWLGVMLLVGSIGMLICLWRRRARFALSIMQCVLFTILLTVVGVAGAKVLYILECYPYSLENGLSLGGVSFYGSVFLIPMLMPLVGRLFKLRSGQTLDACGPCVAVMIGCLRVSCFLSGCCGGWEACIGEFCFQWPTQAIDSISDFAILFWLLRVEEKDAHEGKLYPLFMISYSVMRFFLEFLRDTQKDWVGMSHGQWFALAAILIGAIWLNVKKRGKIGGDYEKTTA